MMVLLLIHADLNEVENISQENMVCMYMGSWSIRVETISQENKV